MATGVRALVVLLLLAGCGPGVSTSPPECGPQCRARQGTQLTTPREVEAVPVGRHRLPATWAHVGTAPDRTSITIAVETGGCTRFSYALVAAGSERMTLQAFVTTPLAGEQVACTADVSYGPFAIDLPRPLRVGERIGGQCDVPPPGPTRGIDLCEVLHQQGTPPP